MVLHLVYGSSLGKILSEDCCNLLAMSNKNLKNIEICSLMFLWLLLIILTRNYHEFYFILKFVSFYYTIYLIIKISKYYIAILSHITYIFTQKFLPPFIFLLLSLILNILTSSGYLDHRIPFLIPRDNFSNA